MSICRVWLFECRQCLQLAAMAGLGGPCYARDLWQVFESSGSRARWHVTCFAYGAAAHAVALTSTEFDDMLHRSQVSFGSSVFGVALLAVTGVGAAQPAAAVPLTVGSQVEIGDAAGNVFTPSPVLGDANGLYSGVSFLLDGAQSVSASAGVFVLDYRRAARLGSSSGASVSSRTSISRRSRTRTRSIRSGARATPRATTSASSGAAIAAASSTTRRRRHSRWRCGSWRMARVTATSARVPFG